MSPTLSKLLSLLALVGTSSAAAVVKRNPCDGVDASPELYHEYRTDVCPPKNRLDADGTCPFVDGFDGPDLKYLRCAKYCEIRTNVSLKWIITYHQTQELTKPPSSSGAGNNRLPTPIVTVP